MIASARRVGYSRPRYRSEPGAAIMSVAEQVCLAVGYFTERAAGQGVWLMSGLSPRDCVSLFGKVGIEGASVRRLQRLAADAGRLRGGCADDALAAMRAGAAIQAQATSVCTSLDGTMCPMIPEGKGVARTISDYVTQGVRLHALYLREMPEPRKGNRQAAAGGGPRAHQQAPPRVAACCRRRRGRRAYLPPGQHCPQHMVPVVPLRLRRDRDVAESCLIPETPLRNLCRDPRSWPIH